MACSCVGRTRTMMQVSVAESRTRKAPLYAKRRPPPGGERRLAVELLDDLGDPAGAEGTATPPDREPQTLVHGDGLGQLHPGVRVVPAHPHLGAPRQRHPTGHVGGAEVELRTVVVEERRVPAAFVLGQDVDLTF